MTIQRIEQILEDNPDMVTGEIFRQVSGGKGAGKSHDIFTHGEQDAGKLSTVRKAPRKSRTRPKPRR